MFLFISMFLFLLPSLSAQDCTLIDDDAIVHKQITAAESFCLQVRNGFNILFEVESVETGKETLDHLLIKEGKTINDDGKGLIFVHKLKEKQTFLIFSSKAFVQFAIADEQKAPGRASITYRRVGKEVITTTESPTTVNPWPQPSANDSIYYTVHVSGYPYTAYNNVKTQTDFRTSVAKMAIEYVQTNNFPIIESITFENVLLSEIKMCELDLPESTSCAVITFAVPLILSDDYVGYELKTPHLALMWERYGDLHLAEGGFSEYRVPDLTDATIAWSSTIAVVVILLMAFIVAGMVLYPIIRRKMKEDNDDTPWNLRVTKNRNSDDIGELHPHLDLQVPSMCYESEDDANWVQGSRLN